MGIATIVTEVVTGLAGHPPNAGIVYVTTYTPSVLVLGVIEPLDGLIDNPAGAEKIPPE